MTDQSHPVGDAATMLRSATEAISSRPPNDLVATLGVAWACFSLILVSAGRLAGGGTARRHPLYYEIEVRAWLARYVLDQAPSTPPWRRPLQPTWVNVGPPGQVVKGIVALSTVLAPVLAEAGAALAGRTPGREPVDLTAFDRAILDHSVAACPSPGCRDLDLRAVGVCAAAARLIASDLRII